MKNDCLLHFKNPYQFKNFIFELGIYNGWRIDCGLMNNRGKNIESRGYTKILRKLFEENKLFRKQVSIAEIVSFLDTFVHLERVLNLLISKEEQNIIKEIEILFEYKIEMSKMSRVDCIIKYKDRICLFELRTVDSFNKLKTAYDKKRIELMIYKDMMLNYMDKIDKIVVLPLIGLYEYKDKKLNQEFYENNLKNAEFACEYIQRYILQK